MSTALLLIAHGSRNAAANDEVVTLTAQLAQAPVLQARFACIRCAFLELCAPDIPTLSTQLYQQQCSRQLWFPYFLVAGKHVVRDLKRYQQQLHHEHPQLHITLTSHLGASTLLLQCIIQTLLGIEPH